MVKSTWPGVSMMLKRNFVSEVPSGVGFSSCALPEGGGRGRGDGDPALLLLLHPVHRRGAVMHLADLVGLAGVVEDTLGRRGLAGVDMRHDPEVAVARERVVACHWSVLRLEVGYQR
jgi:hypothetical protein